jgi:hypothetical protein
VLNPSGFDLFPDRARPPQFEILFPPLDFFALIRLNLSPARGDLRPANMLAQRLGPKRGPGAMSVIGR